MIRSLRSLILLLFLKISEVSGVKFGYIFNDRRNDQAHFIAFGSLPLSEYTLYKESINLDLNKFQQAYSKKLNPSSKSPKALIFKPKFVKTNSLENGKIQGLLSGDLDDFGSYLRTSMLRTFSYQSTWKYAKFYNYPVLILLAADPEEYPIDYEFKLYRAAISSRSIQLDPSLLKFDSEMMTLSENWLDISTYRISGPSYSVFEIGDVGSTTTPTEDDFKIVEAEEEIAPVYSKAADPEQKASSANYAADSKISSNQNNLDRKNEPLSTPTAAAVSNDPIPLQLVIDSTVPYQKQDSIESSGSMERASSKFSDLVTPTFKEIPTPKFNESDEEDYDTSNLVDIINDKDLNDHLKFTEQAADVKVPIIADEKTASDVSVDEKSTDSRDSEQEDHLNHSNIGNGPDIERNRSSDEKEPNNDVEEAVVDTSNTQTITKDYGDVKNHLNEKPVVENSPVTEPVDVADDIDVEHSKASEFASKEPEALENRISENEVAEPILDTKEDVTKSDVSDAESKVNAEDSSKDDTNEPIAEQEIKDISEHSSAKEPDTPMDDVTDGPDEPESNGPANVNGDIVFPAKFDNPIADKLDDNAGHSTKTEASDLALEEDTGKSLNADKIDDGSKLPINYPDDDIREDKTESDIEAQTEENKKDEAKDNDGNSQKQRASSPLNSDGVVESGSGRETPIDIVTEESTANTAEQEPATKLDPLIPSPILIDSNLPNDSTFISPKNVDLTENQMAQVTADTLATLDKGREDTKPEVTEDKGIENERSNPEPSDPTVNNPESIKAAQSDNVVPEFKDEQEEPEDHPEVKTEDTIDHGFNGNDADQEYETPDKLIEDENRLDTNTTPFTPISQIPDPTKPSHGNDSVENNASQSAASASPEVEDEPANTGHGITNPSADQDNDHVEDIKDDSERGSYDGKITEDTKTDYTIQKSEFDGSNTVDTTSDKSNVEDAKIGDDDEANRPNVLIPTAATIDPVDPELNKNDDSVDKDEEFKMGDADTSKTTDDDNQNAGSIVNDNDDIETEDSKDYLIADDKNSSGPESNDQKAKEDVVEEDVTPVVSPPENAPITDIDIKDTDTDESDGNITESSGDADEADVIPDPKDNVETEFDVVVDSKDNDGNEITPTDQNHITNPVLDDTADVEKDLDSNVPDNEVKSEHKEDNEDVAENDVKPVVDLSEKAEDDGSSADIDNTKSDPRSEDIEKSDNEDEHDTESDRNVIDDNVLVTDPVECDMVSDEENAHETVRSESIDSILTKDTETKSETSEKVEESRVDNSISESSGNEKRDDQDKETNDSAIDENLMIENDDHKQDDTASDGNVDSIDEHHKEDNNDKLSKNDAEQDVIDDGKSDSDTSAAIDDVDVASDRDNEREDSSHDDNIPDSNDKVDNVIEDPKVEDIPGIIIDDSKDSIDRTQNLIDIPLVENDTKQDDDVDIGDHESYRDAAEQKEDQVTEESKDSRDDTKDNEADSKKEDTSDIEDESPIENYSDNEDNVTDGKDETEKIDQEDDNHDEDSEQDEHSETEDLIKKDDAEHDTNSSDKGKDDDDVSDISENADSDTNSKISNLSVSVKDVDYDEVKSSSSKDDNDSDDSYVDVDIIPPIIDDLPSSGHSTDVDEHKDDDHNERKTDDDDDGNLREDEKSSSDSDTKNNDAGDIGSIYGDDSEDSGSIISPPNPLRPRNPRRGRHRYRPIHRHPRRRRRGSGSPVFCRCTIIGSRSGATVNVLVTKHFHTTRCPDCLTECGCNCIIT